LIDQNLPELLWPQAVLGACGELLNEPVVTAGVTAFVWAWLTFAAMLIFRISMRRARVRPVHALRCVVYSSDVIMWFNVAALAMAGLWAVEAITRLQVFTSGLENWFQPILFGVIALAALAFFYRLAVSIGSYMRFDHAWATAAATQVIVALTVMIALVLLYNARIF
jgi:hypothetical protein